MSLCVARYEGSIGGELGLDIREIVAEAEQGGEMGTGDEEFLMGEDDIIGQVCCIVGGVSLRFFMEDPERVGNDQLG